MTLYCFDTPNVQITLCIAERGKVLLNPNPTARLFHTEKSPAGSWLVWVGKRVNIIIERPSSASTPPLFSISRIG